MANMMIRREQFPADVTKIQQAVIAGGYDCSRKDAAELWRKFSDTMCAGWLIVEGYSAESILKAVEPFIDPLDE